MNEIEAMKMALEFIVLGSSKGWFTSNEFEVVAALRQAIERAEKQEPAVWMIQYKDRHEFVWGSKPEFCCDTVLGIEPLYTTPPKREWVGLTVQEIEDLECCLSGFRLYRAIEAKLKEKNGG